MLKYLIKRLLLAIPVLLATAMLVFSALHLVGGDPVFVLAGPTAPQETRDAIRKKMGFDEPLHIQFAIYMGQILKGDLGKSIKNRKDVSQIIIEKLPITAELGVTAFSLAYLLAIPLGILAALNRNSFIDWTSMIAALIGVSMPGFWLGLILMYIFSLYLKLLPPTGFGSIETLILPALALGLPRVGRIARITRSSVLEVIDLDYVRTARAKGLTERVVVMKHTLRNAILPIISLMGLDLGYIIGGSVVIESVFARNGIGDMMLRSILARDFPSLQGAMFVLAAAIILSNIISDLVYMVVDPRIRH